MVQPKLCIQYFHIETKCGEDPTCQGHMISKFYHRAKFHADRWHRRRDVCPRTKNTHTSYLISFYALYWRIAYIRHTPYSELEDIIKYKVGLCVYFMGPRWSIALPFTEITGKKLEWCG